MNGISNIYYKKLSSTPENISFYTLSLVTTSGKR